MERNPLLVLDIETSSWTSRPFMATAAERKNLLGLEQSTAQHYEGLKEIIRIRRICVIFVDYHNMFATKLRTY